VVDPNWTLPLPERVSGVPAALARTAALDWFEQRRPHLLACLDDATTNHLHHWVVRLTGAMAGFLRNHGPWDQAITLHEAAVRAAAHLADEPARAVALNDLGIMYRLACKPADTALPVLREAHDIFSGDLPAHVRPRDAKLGQANALHEQGVVHNHQHDYDDAVDVLKPAFDLYREIVDRIGMANAAKNLGVAQYKIGLRGAALALLDEAIGHYHEADDTLGQVEVLNHRGSLYLTSDEPDPALDDFRTALNRVDEVGSPLERARANEGIGLCHDRNGEFAGAATFLENARDIYTRIGAHRHRDRVMAKLDELRSYPDA
jgi:tetratricopeptide (TPR) repeat protein